MQCVKPFRRKLGALGLRRGLASLGVLPLHGLESPPEPRVEQREAARYFFRKGGAFVGTDASEVGKWDPQRAEVVLLGRSNAGKTTLLNALLSAPGSRRQQFGNVSKRPGGTRRLEFFAVGREAAASGVRLHGNSRMAAAPRKSALDRDGRGLSPQHWSPLVVVDVPGYGWSARGERESAEWGHRLDRYFSSRLRHDGVLRRAVVVVDGRVGLQDADFAMLELLERQSVPAMVALTKMDGVRGLATDRGMQAAATLSTHCPTVFPALPLLAAKQQHGLLDFIDTLGLAARLDDVPLRKGSKANFRQAKRYIKGLRRERGQGTNG